MAAFNIGDLVVYGTTGICKVEDIVDQQAPGTDTVMPYYVLEPVIRGGLIKTPVNTRLLMRNAIGKDEAERILGVVPTLIPEILDSMSVQQLTETYSALVETHRLEDLAKLAMSIYRRKVTPERQRCKYGRVDVKYMKLAEELFCGELSVALGISYDEMKKAFAEAASKCPLGLQ